MLVSIILSPNNNLYLLSKLHNLEANFCCWSFKKSKLFTWGNQIWTNHQSSWIFTYFPHKYYFDDIHFLDGFVFCTPLLEDDVTTHSIRLKYFFTNNTKMIITNFTPTYYCLLSTSTTKIQLIHITTSLTPRPTPTIALFFFIQVSPIILHILHTITVKKFYLSIIIIQFIFAVNKGSLDLGGYYSKNVPHVSQWHNSSSGIVITIGYKASASSIPSKMKTIWQ